jgi:hypothetical protein
MGGGLMQLVAMGAQDVYLTGNPQITFFKVVYRRHTNFSKEAIEQTFNGSLSAGAGTLNCTLSRNGDLVQEIYLTGSVSNIGTGEDATSVIKSVEVEIGGQKIDKHYSQWLDIYNELFETDSSHARRLVISGEGSTVYIPLRFWFNRNPGLALPLIALQYHEVKINVECHPIAVNLINATTAAVLSSPKLLVNYLYLDTDERRRFAQVSHEYLIEQVQHTGVENKAKITMNFNHPVKALFWTSQKSPSGKAKLQLNGHDRFSDQFHDYFHLVQPYECGLGHSLTLNTSTRKWGEVAVAADNNNVSMYSFCLKPAEHQPSGTCNFSRIDNAVLNLGGSTYSSSGKGVYLFALNYNVLRIMSGMGGLAYSN